MCFVSTDRGDRPEAYRIHRLDDSADGYHDRRYSSVESHMRRAPLPKPGYSGKKYPHRYRNKEKHYPAGSSLYEYPTMDYPYSTQNSKGQAKRYRDDGGFDVVSPRYTRTITDRHKKIHGVSYHPYGQPKPFIRAEERYRRR